MGKRHRKEGIILGLCIDRAYLSAGSTDFVLRSDMTSSIPMLLLMVSACQLFFTGVKDGSSGLAMILHVQDILWSPLRSFVLSIPPSRSRYFPVITGSIWFLTLAALLLTWLGRGMPRYPGQTNPDVA